MASEGRVWLVRAGQGEQSHRQAGVGQQVWIGARTWGLKVFFMFCFLLLDHCPVVRAKEEGAGMGSVTADGRACK